MKNNIAQQLKKLRHGEINPSAEWVSANRAMLLSQIKNTVPKTAPAFALENVWSWLSVFMPRQMVYSVVRPVAVLVIVALVGTSGAVAAVDASYEALPGDFLYPATRAAQKTQIALVSLVGGSDAETQARVKVAQSLAVKTQKIIKINDSSKNARLSIAVADLKSEITTISNKLEQTTTNPNETIKSEVVKDVKTNSDQIKGVLEEVKDNLKTSTNAADQDLTKQVSEAKDLAKDVSVQAVGVLVTNYVKGDSETSLEDVKKVIATTAESVNSDATASKQTVADVKTIVDTVKTEVKEEPVIKDSAGKVIASERAELIDSVSNQTVAAIIKTDVAVNDVAQKTIEATQLVNSGDLIRAVDKIKEASEATKVAEQISDSAVATVQTVAPVVVVKDAAILTPSPSDATNTPGLPIIVITTTIKMVTTTPKMVTGTLPTK